MAAHSVSESDEDIGDISYVPDVPEEQERRKSPKKASKKSPKKRKKSSTAANESYETGPTLLGLENLEDGFDEAWIVKIPAHINPNKLIDQKIILDSSSVNCIEVRDKKPLQAKVSKKKTQVPFLARDEGGKMKPVSLQCRGEITLTEYSEYPDLPSPKKLTVVPIAQPEGIKRRHPFFGTELPPQIASVVSPEESSSKSKKRKRMST